MCSRYLTTRILLWERSEEEKERRRKFGDKGAKFKVGKVPRFAPPRHSWNDNHDGNEGHTACRNL